MFFLNLAGRLLLSRHFLWKPLLKKTVLRVHFVTVFVVLVKMFFIKYRLFDFACKIPSRLLNLLISLDAVISGRHFRNPVSLAKKVMYDSRHCALSGDGALKFATNKNFPTCDPDELMPEQARKKLRVSYEDYLKCSV